MSLAKRGKLTPELADTLCEAAKSNLSHSSVARAAGISPRTLKRYLERGEQGDEAYASFAARYEAARAWGADIAVQSLLAAACQTDKPHSVRASETILDRFYGSDYAKKVNTGGGTQVNVNVGSRSHAPPLDLSSYTQEEVAALRRIVEIAQALTHGNHHAAREGLYSLAGVLPADIEVEALNG